MDNLEKYIKENRADLDKYNAPQSTWRGIKRRMRTGKKVVPAWLSAAAIITIISGTAIILYTLSLKRSSAVAESKFGQSGLKETEIYYNTLVNTLYLEAKPLLTGQHNSTVSVMT
jgi:hypothetical protein